MKVMAISIFLMLAAASLQLFVPAYLLVGFSTGWLAHMIHKVHKEV